MKKSILIFGSIVILISWLYNAQILKQSSETLNTLTSIKTLQESQNKALQSIVDIQNNNLNDSVEEYRQEITKKADIKIEIAKNETNQTKIDLVEEKLNNLGKMGEAVRQASKEFNVPTGLILGIYNAESSMGTKFYNPVDKNCHNWAGLKGGKTDIRIKTENSWLRCFNDELAGARTVAKTLKLYYLDEGKDTPEKIANKWVGNNQSVYHKQWVKNVNKYFIN